MLRRDFAPARPDGRAPLPAHLLVAQLGRLPTRLNAMPADARELLGRALDAGRVRLLRDDDGSVLVARARS